MGRTFMTPVDCPFRAADAVLEEIGSEPEVIIVDMHAEATSEKKAHGLVSGRQGFGGYRNTHSRADV